MKFSVFLRKRNINAAARNAPKAEQRKLKMIRSYAVREKRPALCVDDSRSDSTALFTTA